MTKPHLYIRKTLPVEAYQWFEKDGSTLSPNPGFEPTIRFTHRWELMCESGWCPLKDGDFIYKQRVSYWALSEEKFFEAFNAVPSDFDTRPNNCSARLWDEGKVAARTCHVCGLGPCKGRGK